MSKLWNVPDDEFEKLSEAWKRGEISDADFTEKLHELEEQQEDKRR
jgi:hypothetical protein